MIKSRNELEHRKIEIDLNGPEGNAWCLIGLAGSLGKQLNMTNFRIKCNSLKTDSIVNKIIKLYESSPN